MNRSSAAAGDEMIMRYRCSPCVAWLAVACFGVAALPLAVWYGQRVSDRSDEPLGVVALLAAVGWVIARFRDAKERSRVSLRPVWMIGGAVVLVMMQAPPLLYFPMLSGLLAVAILGISVEMSHGKPGILALLVLSLPIIASLDFYAGYPLRLAAVHISVMLLNVAGLGVERAGLTLLDGGNAVGMDPACAGVRMLWTTCFTAAVVATLRRFSWPQMLLLTLGAVGCAVLGNGLRAAIVFFPESGRVHWPEWAHAGAGLVVHGLVLTAVFCLGDRMPGRNFWNAAAKRSGTAAWSGPLRESLTENPRKPFRPGEVGGFVALRRCVPKFGWAAMAVCAVVSGALLAQTAAGHRSRAPSVAF
jgi:exosortase/archaeosortase family protein